MRHVPYGTKWHPATDQLRGTEVYGNANDPSEPFSVQWDSTDFDAVSYLVQNLFLTIIRLEN